jgi:hypothetical protein
MKNRFRGLGLFGVLLLLTVSGVSAQTGVETPTYTNARVVSIDPARRVLVIRNSKGQRESLNLNWDGWTLPSPARREP